MCPVDIHHPRFRTRLFGIDPKEVELFCQQLAEEIERLRVENANLRRESQESAKELQELKEREKGIRTVLLNAHKTAEQLKNNAEKEAQLVLAEAELKAEKILQGAQQRLSQLQANIAELKRYRVQLETKLRTTIETFQNLLNVNEEADGEVESAGKVKLVGR